MKILVNVTQERLTTEWQKLGTAGFRFKEQSDGSFDLHLTTDIALAMMPPMPDPDPDGVMPTI